MKYFFALLTLIVALPVFAEAISGEDRAARCRRQMHSKARMYVEDMEYCQNIIVRESIEKFNNFLTRPEPSPDCPEASESQGLVKACRAVGVQKVKAQGRAWGYEIRDQDVYVCDVDDNWVFDYVWYCANTPKGKIQQMTQKRVLDDCF